MKKWFMMCIMLLFAWHCSIITEAATDDLVVALGADLTAEQRATVLTLMELTESDLEHAKVLTITNEEEHRYLDSYIGPSVIGTKSLTSVKITKGNKGSGIQVTTRNVNYCTTGMYRNALLTAGMEDVNVLVVAPTQLSGTAGLIGAIKAYEKAENVSVSEKVIDAALHEMITTGELEKLSGKVSEEDVEALMAWLKVKMATGELDTGDSESVKETIREGESKFGVALDEGEKEKIVSVLDKLDAVGLDGNYLLGEAEKLFSKYGKDIVNKSQDVIKDAVSDANKAINEAAKEAATSAVKEFVKTMSETMKGFFADFLKK